MYILYNNNISGLMPIKKVHNLYIVKPIRRKSNVGSCVILLFIIMYTAVLL